MAFCRILCTSGMKAHLHSGPQIMRCALLTNLSILLAIEVGRTGKRGDAYSTCLLYTSPSPRDLSTSRMPSSA